ncbi:MAG: hypothetical protein Tsb009_12430 [Planctomycetaceae bacterium]
MKYHYTSYLSVLFAVCILSLSFQQAIADPPKEITIVKGGAMDIGPERLGYDPPQPVANPDPYTIVGGKKIHHFRTYSAIVTQMHNLMAASPSPYVEIGLTAGNSLRGMGIWYLRVSGNSSNKRPCGKPKPVVIFNGGIHAREWISPEMVLRAAEHLINNYNETDRNKKLNNDLKYLVDNCDMYFIPVSNPDAFEYTQSAWNKTVELDDNHFGEAIRWTRDGRMRRKNLQDRSDTGVTYSFAAATAAVVIGGKTYLNAQLGVDLNRNWDPGWGNMDSQYKPSPDRENQSYHGSAKYSEPETQALKNFINTLTGVRALVDYHSYEVSIIYPDTARPQSKRDKDVQKAIEGGKGIKVAHRIPGTVSRYTVLRIPYEKLVGGAWKNQEFGSIINWASQNIARKPLAAAVELPLDDAHDADNFSGAGFIHPAVKQVDAKIWKYNAGTEMLELKTVTIPGIAETFSETMPGLASFIRFATGPQAKKKMKVWKDDDGDGKMSDSEVRFESEWIVNADGLTATLNVIKNEWITQGTYRFLITFDQQMWVPPDNSDEPQDYDGNPALPPTVTFRRKDNPFAPENSVTNPGTLGWYLSRSVQDGQGNTTPGSYAYDFDSWEGDITIPDGASAQFDGREIELKLRAVNLVEFLLDGNPATVVDWNEGWKFYEDQDGVNEPESGGADKSYTLKIDSKRPKLRNALVE